jgi:hypothetical protein
MNLMNDLLACESRPSTLIVLLPGVYDRPQDFVEQGFVAAVRDRKIHADVQMVDAHLGYYTDLQIVQRLEQEVVLPAQAKGYKQIWFAGISLGGYGTLLYSMNKPRDVSGFFLMAPYMGSRAVSQEVHNQGGLITWSSNILGNPDVDLWRWIKGYATKQADLPKAYVGFGLSDRFVKSNTLLADALPKTHSFAIAGGHDWATWKMLWTLFLDSAPLPRMGPIHCVTQ